MFDLDEAPGVGGMVLPHERPAHAAEWLLVGKRRTGAR
jgi:hypothetical protein